MALISTLIFAWILSCFEMDSILISALNEVIGSNYSNNVYWLLAFIIGSIGTILEFITRNKKT